MVDLRELYQIRTAAVRIVKNKEIKGALAPFSIFMESGRIKEHYGKRIGNICTHSFLCSKM